MPNEDFKKASRGDGRKGSRSDAGRPRKRPEDEEDRPRRRPSRDDDDEEEERRQRKRRPRDEVDDEDDEEIEEEETRPRLTATQRRWEKVAQGLLLNVIAASLLLGAIGALVLSVVLIILGGMLSWEDLASFAQMLTFLGFICFVGKEIPAAIGYGFCLKTPNKKGALGLAITCLVISCTSLAAFVMFIILPLLDRGMAGAALGTGGFAGGLAGIIFLVVSFTEWIIFPLYLKAVSQILKDAYQDQACNIPIALACAVIGATIILVFVTAVKLVRGESGAGMIFAVLFGLVLLIMLFFSLTYLKAILAVRMRVARMLPGGDEVSE